MPLPFLNTVIILTLVLAICFLSLSSGGLSYFYALLVFPVGVFFVVRPARIFVLAIALSFSTLRLPFFPMSLTLFQVVQAILSFFLVFYMVMDKRARHAQSGMRICAMIFTAVIVITMVIRGVGIRALGSSLWGGGGYISLFICLSFLLMTDVLRLTTKEWKMAVLGMCLLSLLPPLGEMIYFASKGAVQIQYSFLQSPLFSTITLEALEGGKGMVRYGTGFANILILVPFIFMERPFVGHKTLLSVLVIICSMIFTMFSGSRTSFIENLMFIGLWFASYGGNIRWHRIFFFMLASAGLIMLLALFAQHLPISLQRSLTIVPFADVAWEVKHDAMGTWDWRLDVWLRAMEDIPRALLLGQGLAFDPQELLALVATGTFTRDWAFVVHSYHQGLLSLLLIFGLLGLLSGLGLLFLGLRRHIQFLKNLEWQDPFIRRLHAVILCVFCAQVFKYVFIYGDVHVSFPHILFFLAFLEALVKTNVSMFEKDSRENKLSWQALVDT